MAKYVFQGPQTNLGRFGFVDKGAVLELTENEEHSIKGDRRFRSHKGDDPVEQGDLLDKQNDPETVRRASLQEKSIEELRSMAAVLSKNGSTIEYRGGADKASLIGAILRATAK